MLRDKNTRWVKVGSLCKHYAYPCHNKCKSNIDFRIPIRYFGNIFFVARPRVFKSALAKSLTVRVSNFRRVIVFDYNGEWSRDVVDYNWGSQEPARIVNVQVYKNFTFKISTFKNPQDFISLGFSKDSCQYLKILINDGYSYYEDDVEKFEVMLKMLPTSSNAKNDMLTAWKESFPRLDLPTLLHFGTKSNLLNHFLFIRDWFWQGKKDTRPLYDFCKEMRKDQHAIIDLSLGEEGTNTNHARAWCGAVLRQCRGSYERIRGFFVFEESSVLAPNMYQATEDEWPSSLVEIRDMVVYFPKKFVSCLFLCQNERQLHGEITSFYHMKCICMGEGQGEEYVIAGNGAEWNYDVNYRKVLFWEANREWKFFHPEISVCHS